jgi:hypothetical protein
LGVVLDRLILPSLPTLQGEQVVLRGHLESDADDRLRHPIDPGEEDGYGPHGGGSGMAAATTPASI